MEKAVVLQYHGMETDQLSRICKILEKCRNQKLDAFYRTLIKSFGQKPGSGYYAVLKPHVRVIWKL